MDFWSSQWSKLFSSPRLAVSKTLHCGITIGHVSPKREKRAVSHLNIEEWRVKCDDRRPYSWSPLYTSVSVTHMKSNIKHFEILPSQNFNDDWVCVMPLSYFTLQIMCLGPDFVDDRKRIRRACKKQNVKAQKNAKNPFFSGLPDIFLTCR